MREYRVRAAIVLCFMLSLSFAVGIAALFPSFKKTADQQQAQLGMAAELKKAKEGSGAGKIENELATSNSILGLFTDQSGSTRLSLIIQNIAKIRGHVVLTSFALKRTDAHTVAVSIHGQAPVRDDLLSLKSSLEALAPGTKVDLPVSVLAKSNNIDFSLVVTEPLP